MADRTTFIDEFRAVTPKQWIAVVVAIAIGMVMEIFAANNICFSMLIVPILLYMLPHMAGVSSVKVKAVVGALFFGLLLIVGTFAYTPGNESTDWTKDPHNENITNVTFDEITDVVTVDVDYPGDGWTVRAIYGKVTALWFGSSIRAVEKEITIDMTRVGSTDTFEGLIDTEKGNLYMVVVQILDSGGKVQKSLGFTINTGLEDGLAISFMGGLYVVGFGGLVYFIIVGLSAAMRRSLDKTRTRMEAEGRLYPKGYGRCKECGTLVLPGEVTCKKCGAYIEVPDEIKAAKKDYFVCTECGAEVPNDAVECPKCGVKFDGEESEVVHADGTVDITDETFECSECGAIVPVNALHCPKCGAKFDEEE